MKHNTSSKKRDNFERIAENRVNRILVLFNQLENLRNKSFYEYNEEDIDKIFSVLEKELNNTKNALINSNKKKNRFEL